MNISSVSQASTQIAAQQQQGLQRLHAAPVIPSQRQLGANGLPNSAMEPTSAVKVGQAMAGGARGHLMNMVA